MNIGLYKKDDPAYAESLLFNPVIPYVNGCVILGGQSSIKGTYNGTERKASLPGRARGGLPKYLKSLRYGRADPLQSNNEEGGLIYGIRY